MAIRKLQPNPPTKFKPGGDMVCGDLSPVTVTSNLNHQLLLLPIDLIMSHGARNYDKDHYFVKAINSLISSNPHDSPDKVLESYYNNHQPANILAAHRLGGGDTTLGPSEYPWLVEPEGLIDRGERGLSSRHGVQQYGPCSRKKVLLEARRLEKLYRSIKRHGVNQHIDSNDYPSGYFLLRKNGAYRFILNNGQHRLAAYYVFGERRIFVTLDKYGRPAIIRETDANLWPMVREGKITKDDGLRVFDCYFRNHESGNAH